MASSVPNSSSQPSSQGQGKPEQRGGFDCDFVDSPPDVIQTECPVCLLIIREPHQVICCGNSFCYSCIQRVKDSNKPCPICKTEEFSCFPDKKLKRSLSSFRVLCSHEKDGCDWIGELGQLDTHLNKDPQPERQLNGCRFTEIDCLYECGDTVHRQYMQKHRAEHCTKRPFSCEHCHNYESNYDDVIHNHWPVCGSFPLRCPNQCGSFPQRQDIASLLADECPLKTINCSFFQVGCTAQVPRKDMPEHLKENLLPHMSLLATSYTKQQAEIIEHQAEITKLQAENVDLQAQIASLTAEKTALRTTKLELRCDFLRDENTLLKKEMPFYHKNFKIKYKVTLFWVYP